jgi:hypothetical protein
MPDPIATSTIVAQAFRLMEKSPISSFADDSEEAAAAAEQYAIAMEMCLEACDWSFASVFVTLPEAASLPSGNAADAALPYTYQMPGDCITLQEVGVVGDTWRRDRDLLRADAPGPLPVRYTGKITDEAKLPAIFRTAVAYQLAALLAPRWITTRTKVSDLQSYASQYLKQAMARDGRQASPMRYDGLADEGDWAARAVW